MYVMGDVDLNTECWRISVAGDTSNYRAATKVADKVNYGVISIKNTVWKGHTTVFHNKQWASIYIGYGAKTSDRLFYPSQPDPVLTECKDR